MATRNEADYPTSFQNIWTNIQIISQNTSSMHCMLSQLGTAADNQELRYQLHQTQFRTAQLARDTCKSLKDLDFGSMPPSDELRALKLQKERLLVDFSNVITHFQSVQGDAARWEETKDEAKSSYFKELQAGVEDINNIFKEMAQKVRDQGEEVEKFGVDFDEAEVNIEAGAQHLSIAESFMNQLRRNKCIIGIVFVVLVAIIIIGIVVWKSS